MPPQFDFRFRESLIELFRWRRDVRNFLPTPVSDETLIRLIQTAALAPSVGYSQPWRWVRVEDEGRRRAVIDNFQVCNREALEAFDGPQAKRYAVLKLAGLQEAPLHLAVFADQGTERGHGLGRRTMPEMLDYSAVMAVHTFWLAARTEGIGVGWVSILDPHLVSQTLGVPDEWTLVAYLCVGYPSEESETPELERQRWEEKADVEVLRR